MVVDYRDNQREITTNADVKQYDALFIDAVKDGVARIVKGRRITSNRHNINLYMPSDIVKDFRSVYLASLSKRDRRKYKPLVAKNIVAIGGYRLQIRTKMRGYELPIRDDGEFDMYVRAS
jgi:hypothetical protein